jgi:ubiquinone/menaquinone biosynthesis C-methylase UbiE
MGNDSLNKKDALQQVFTRTAASYADIRYFPIFGQWLVDTTNIPAGAQVLDVASGRGAVLFPAADRVGPGGRVIGTDLAEGMARETALEIKRRGLKHAQSLQMDAEHLKFPDDTFDFVVCGFSLQFFPHLDQALAEFRRVLKPGGRAVVTTWGDDDPAWDWFQDLRESRGAVLKLGSNSLDKPDEVQRWFRGAGFSGVNTISRDLDMVYKDDEEWWNVEWSISGRAGLDKLGPQELEQFKTEAFAKAKAQRQPDGYHCRLAAYCTTAVK